MLPCTCPCKRNRPYSTLGAHSLCCYITPFKRSVPARWEPPTPTPWDQNLGCAWCITYGQKKEQTHTI